MPKLGEESKLTNPKALMDMLSDPESSKNLFKTISSLKNNESVEMKEVICNVKVPVEIMNLFEGLASVVGINVNALFSEMISKILLKQVKEAFDMKLEVEKPTEALPELSELFGKIERLKDIANQVQGLQGVFENVRTKNNPKD
jgi:hypothetical protein